MKDEVIVKTGSAITILNAIKSSHGAAIGIDVPITVKITDNEKLSYDIYPDNIGPSLLEACIARIENEFGININQIKIKTNSPFPAECGLKTSSAISCATIQAISMYYDLKLSLHKIVSLSAKASIDARVSITGAIDDAYASFCGGLAFTENKTRKLIFLKTYNTDMVAVLLITKKVNPKVKIAGHLDRIDNKSLELALDCFQKGNIIAAIKYNTQAYAPLLLENYDIISELNQLNTTIVGLNGAGPSLFALCDQKQLSGFKMVIRENYDEFNIVVAPIKKVIRSIES